MSLVCAAMSLEEYIFELVRASLPCAGSHVGLCALDMLRRDEAGHKPFSALSRLFPSPSPHFHQLSRAFRTKPPMASHDLDVPGLGQHLVIAPQVQLPLAAAKKHPLEVDAAVEKSPRSRRVKKSRLGEGVDIAVAREFTSLRGSRIARTRGRNDGWVGMWAGRTMRSSKLTLSFAGTHGGSSEHDELDSDQVGGDEGGDDDDFVDPSLKQVKPDRVKRFAARAAVVHSPPRDFAHNTGAFMNLPLPSRNHSSNAPNASVGDYTHISQALAHQPLATNPSQQTMSLLAKLSSSASMNAGTEADRVTLFMEEMRAQVGAQCPHVLL